MIFRIDNNTKLQRYWLVLHFLELLLSRVDSKILSLVSINELIFIPFYNLNGCRFTLKFDSLAHLQSSLKFVYNSQVDRILKWTWIYLLVYPHEVFKTELFLNTLIQILHQYQPLLSQKFHLCCPSYLTYLLVMLDYPSI